MATFKDMKIKTPTDQDCIDVQEALFKLGYAWQKSSADLCLYKWIGDCYGIYTDKTGVILREIKGDDRDSAEFARSGEAEHFLHNGEFVTEIPAKPSLPDIRIRVTPSSPVGDIVAALEAMGYVLQSESIKRDIENDDVSWLFGNGCGLIGSAEKRDSATADTLNEYEERFLWNGKLVPLSYFAQPVTTSIVSSSIENLSSITANIGSIAKPSLKSKEEWQRERKIDILQAMLEKYNDNEPVPEEWQGELDTLFWENK